ncbi:MAG TPA: hypothetical protein VF783_16395 [Terriglobales bacterium]
MARPNPLPDAPASSLRKRPRVRVFAILLIVITASAIVGSCSDVASSPCRTALALTANEISERLAAKNAERARRLVSFEGKRHYAIEYSGFPSAYGAQMNVNASYHAPGTKKLTIVSESGSRLILNHVLHRLIESEEESAGDDANRSAVALTSENYQFSLRGCQMVAGRDLYVMDVQPLRDNKFLYRGTIWVDAQDFAVVRIDAEPARNPSFWTKHSEIHHQYQKIGDFYLPAFNQTVTETRLGGHAVLTIRYEGYKLDGSGGKRIAEN